MSFTPFDSPLYRELISDTELAVLFSDAAEIRAMLLFEEALADAQGELGIIPLESALFISRSAREVQLDPSALAKGLAAAGVAGPALVAAFRAEMKAPEHAQWAHHGASSQDLVDTGLVIRLRRAADILQQRIEVLAETLGVQANQHAHVVMAARTRHQIATPTTFGARVATWHAPLPRHLQRLSQLRPRVEVVSLAGASGTAAALGPQAVEVEGRVAAALGLAPSRHPWNATRDGLAEFAGWLALVSGSMGKIATDVLQLIQAQPPQMGLSSGGGSSTMPHKANPVAAETIVALARHVATLSSSLMHSQLTESDRDGSAWVQEWLCLPQLICATGAALRHTQQMIEGIVPDADAMRATIEATHGTMFAEPVTFALAEHMPRPEAAALVKEACTLAGPDRSLRTILEAESPVVLDWDALFDPVAQCGRAVALARAPAKGGDDDRE